MRATHSNYFVENVQTMKLDHCHWTRSHLLAVCNIEYSKILRNLFTNWTGQLDAIWSAFQIKVQTSCRPSQCEDDSANEKKTITSEIVQPSEN